MFVIVLWWLCFLPIKLLVVSPYVLCDLKHYISISLLFLDSINLDPIIHGHVGGVEKRLIF